MPKIIIDLEEANDRFVKKWKAKYDLPSKEEAIKDLIQKTKEMMTYGKKIRRKLRTL